MTLAKALGNGVPIGACLTRGVAAEVIQPGNHGSTFGGNPLACTAVVTTIDAIREQGLLENALRVGKVIREGLGAELAGLAGVAEIRGMGLMLGLQLERPCGELVKAALEAGLIVNVTADSVLRMLPPLVMNEAEGAMVVERLAPLVKALLAREPSPPQAAAAR
jgi:acetylornithine aminotransferase